MKELKEIINEINEIGKEFNLKFTDDKILDIAGRIFNTKLIQNYKQEKINNISLNKQKEFTNQKPNSLATPKQIETLYKLNADFNAEKITKKEASLLLSKLLPKRK